MICAAIAGAARENSIFPTGSVPSLAVPAAPALFPDGSWICDGVAYQQDSVIANAQNRDVTQEEIDTMAVLSQEYRTISNLLLSCNYYK